MDTCAFLWLAGQPAKLSAPVVAAINLKSEIQTAKNAKYAKWKGIEPKMQFSRWVNRSFTPIRSVFAWFAYFAVSTAFFQLARVRISLEALFRSGELPSVHAEPFDRLLAAQALVEGFQFVSPEPPFRALGANCLW